MKILMLSQGLPFPIYRDGLTLRVYHLLHEFSKQAECHLIAFGDYELTSKEKQDLKAIASFDVVNFKPRNGVGGLLTKALSKRRYYSKEFENKIRESILSFEPDVVIAEQTFMAQYVNVLGHLPKVMSAVDAISLAALKQAEIDKTLLKYISWRYVAQQRLSVEKKYFKKFDKTTVVSWEDAEFLQAKLNQIVYVIPNGVDTEYFSPIYLDDRRDTIFFSGNLSAPMNEEACLYLLQHIFPVIHAKHPELLLVIAGRDPTEKIMASTPPYVALKADLPDMRNAMCNALLSVSPIAYGTGIKNNVLQAMAMGIPVVSTKLIAEPIGVRCGETGFVAERGLDFLQTIEKALADRTSLIEIGKAARLHIENNFSWERVASTYMGIFSDVVTENTRK